MTIRVSRTAQDCEKKKKEGWKRAQIMLHTGDIIPAIQLVSST
jgi:hypothetical protein